MHGTEESYMDKIGPMWDRSLLYGTAVSSRTEKSYAGQKSLKGNRAVSCGTE